MNPMHEASWSPWVAGAGIGVLSWLAFATAQRGLGVTSAVEGMAAAVGQDIAPRLIGANQYLLVAEPTPKVDWEWTLVTGVVLGSMASAIAGGTVDRGGVPERWARRFGPDPAVRNLGAFVGGALMMFGARMAKGCTSGHGITGTMQLAGSSWLFTPLMGVSAALAARALFPREQV